MLDYKKAVEVAIRKYKHMLENYLDEVIDNENSDEDLDNTKKSDSHKYRIYLQENTMKNEPDKYLRLHKE
jgi:hypothetical protein